MKAIVLENFGDASQLKMHEVPQPHPKTGEVCVRLKAAGFNPVDYKVRKGAYGGKVPLILGADFSGKIEAIGEGVKGFAMGDAVFGLAFGQSSNGSYAQSVCLPQEFVAKMPAALNFEQAASLPVAALTAYRAIIASRAVQKADAVFIAGAGGGVGSLAVQMAKAAGAKEIFTVAGSEESREFLQKQLGLKKECILLYRALSHEQLLHKLVQMNGGQLFNASFDFVGKEMKRLCLELTAHGGHFATIVPEGDNFDFPVWERGKSLCFNRNLSLHFIFLGAESFSGPQQSWGVYSRQLNEIVQFFEKGILKTPHIEVLGDLSLETVIRAHRMLEEGKVKGKLVMRI